MKENINWKISNNSNSRFPPINRS